MKILSQASNKLKKWFKSDISLYRISREVGVTWPTVRNWKKGVHKISYASAKKIMEVEL